MGLKNLENTIHTDVQTKKWLNCWKTDEHKNKEKILKNTTLFVANAGLLDTEYLYYLLNVESRSNPQISLLALVEVSSS